MNENNDNKITRNILLKHLEKLDYVRYRPLEDFIKEYPINK